MPRSLRPQPASGSPRSLPRVPVDETMGAGDFEINVDWVFPNGGEPSPVRSDIERPEPAPSAAPPAEIHTAAEVRAPAPSPNLAPELPAALETAPEPSPKSRRARSDGPGRFLHAFAAICLIFVALVVVILVIQAGRTPLPASVPKPRAVFGSDAAAEAERPAIEAVVRAFHDARTPAEKTAFIRGGEAMLPTLTEYYATHPDEPAIRLFPAGLTVQDTEAPPMVSGRMLYTTDSVVRRWWVEKVGRDRYRLDWRALTGASGIDWRKFVDHPPAAPTVMRVAATFDDCWVGQFRDARRYLCLCVSDADYSAEAFAYAESDSAVAAAIRHAAGVQGCAGSEPDPAVMAARESLSLKTDAGTPLERRARPGQQSASEFRLTVTLAAVPPSEGELLHQFRILEVVRPDWVDPAPGKDAQGPAPQVPGESGAPVTSQR